MRIRENTTGFFTIDGEMEVDVRDQKTVWLWIGGVWYVELSREELLRALDCLTDPEQWEQ